MSFSRNILLWCSQNEWMKTNIPKYSFVRKALKRFMPGESPEAAFKEAKKFKEIGIGTVFTHLGENINDLSEAKKVTDHYLQLLDNIKDENTPTEISIKLTQIGFDLSADETKSNFTRLLNKAAENKIFIWIDMEQSNYVDRTLDFYSFFRQSFQDVGVCVQSYLLRSREDLEKLSYLSPNIRLVKGAYKEPQSIAFKEKSKVDENYFELAKLLLNFVKQKKSRVAFGTHDLILINKIEAYGKANGLDREKIEFQMLYGIRTNEQIRLAKDGCKIKVLISYGRAWYSWYVRRLAERPANIGFVIKNLFIK